MFEEPHSKPLCLALLFACHVIQTCNSAHVLTSGRLSVSIDDHTRAYTVLVDGKSWFNSAGDDLGYSYSADGETFSVSDGTLNPISSATQGKGTDPAGDYESMTLAWGQKGSSIVEFETTFKAYPGRNAIVFQQRWPNALSGLRGSVFPSLKQTYPGKLGTLEYCGSSCGFMVSGKPSFLGISGGASKGYIAIAPSDESGAGTPVSLAIGPLTEHFSNQARPGNTALLYGLASTFDFVPSNYTIETVMVSSADSSKPERASVPSNGETHPDHDPTPKP